MAQLTILLASAFAPTVLLRDCVTGVLLEDFKGPEIGFVLGASKEM